MVSYRVRYKLCEKVSVNITCYRHVLISAVSRVNKSNCEVYLAYKYSIIIFLFIYIYIYIYIIKNLYL